MPQSELTPCHLPTKATLKKYGLTSYDWAVIYNSQNGCCPICGREFSEKVQPVIDHFHVPRYKTRKDKKKWVRGLLCRYDNQRMLPKGMNLIRARNIVVYLEGFEKKITEHAEGPTGS